MLMPSLLSQSVPRTSSMLSTRLAVSRESGLCAPNISKCGGAGGFPMGRMAGGAIEARGALGWAVAAGAWGAGGVGCAIEAGGAVGLGIATAGGSVVSAGGTIDAGGTAGLVVTAGSG